MEEKIILALLFVFMVCIFSIVSSIDRRINKMQKLLEQIAEKNAIIGEEHNEEIDNELISLISKGKIAEAIKRYKNMTGASFKEASQYIDGINNKDK